MKRLVGAVAVVAATAFTFGPWGESDVRQQPVEQQTQGGDTQPDHSLWVVNNTTCAWDADDAWFTGGLNGVLAGGETATVSRCVVADWRSHGIALSVNAPAANLVVEISFSPQGYVFRAVPVLSGNRYVYLVCADGPQYDRSSPTLQPIPNSGFGGVGVVTTVTARLTNPGTRAARKVNALFNLRATPELANQGCAFPLPNSTGTYPGPFISWQT